MANDINSVVLVGRLTRDMELRYLNSGTAVGRFSLAVNRTKRSGDAREEEVSFFDVTVWGRQGEVLNNYLSKGRQVCVSGELRQSRWEQDGQSRSRIEIVANSIQLLGGNTGSSGQSERGSYTNSNSGYQSNQTQSPSQAKTPSGSSFPGPEQFDDDIPF